MSVDNAANELKKLGTTEQQEAIDKAGITLPTPGTLPKSVWEKMTPTQVFWLLVIMFLALVGVFAGLIWLGVDLIRDNESSETAKTVGATIVGAALGMIGASAAGAGAASASSRN